MPLLLAYWRRRARLDRPVAPLRRMVVGAFIVAAAYVLLAVSAQMSQATGAPAHWSWLAVFFLIYTCGELLILPTGLALFGQLAPGSLAATTIALWFSASFAGNLLAGGIGSLWSRMGNTLCFLLVAAVAAIAASMLLLVDRPARALLREGSSVPAAGSQ